MRQKKKKTMEEDKWFVLITKEFDGNEFKSGWNEIHVDHDSDECGQLMLPSDVWWW